MTGMLWPRLRCDGCGEVASSPDPVMSVATLRAEAGAEGWTHALAAGGEVLDACPREECQDAVAGMVNR